MNMQSLTTLVNELQAKGYGPDKAVSERSLRSDYALPDWVGVPPAFVRLLNEQLGTITVGPEIDPPRHDGPPPGRNDSTTEAEPDIFDLFVGMLGGYSKKNDS